MLLFQGEIEANTCQVTQQLHVEGIANVYISINTRKCNTQQFIIRHMQYT